VHSASLAGTRPWTRLTLKFTASRAQDQILLTVGNGGAFDGKAYLSPKAFAAMTTDHIGPGSGVERNYFYFPGDGFGFGYGFGVRTDPGNAVPRPPGSLGEIKWDGATGVYIVVDRAQDMFFVLMENAPSERMRIEVDLKKIIYDAFEK